jgi:hypothetical protein
LPSGRITVSGGDTLALRGSLTVEGGVTVASDASFENDGIVRSYGSLVDVAGALRGTGAFSVGLASTITLEGAVPATQTLSFSGPDGRLNLGAVDGFDEQITGFQPGDRIDLTRLAADYAAYDADSGTVVARQGGVDGDVVATLHVQGPAASGALATAPYGSGGTEISYPGTPPRVRAELGAADQAMRSDLARAGLHAPDGTPVDGSGVRIGILSDSFDAKGDGSASDPANRDAAAGYLPLDPDTGGSAVTVLKEGSAGSVDEGRAMAELIHRVTPGAQIDFYTATGGQDAFAGGVDALRAAGCNLIVDDWSFPTEPFYQDAGPVAAAQERAVAAGINVFTSAGNYGSAYYEHAFTPEAVQLLGEAADVEAQQFGNGTPFQTVTIPANTSTRLVLQWDAAYPPPGGSVPDSMVVKLYDADGTPLGASKQVANAPDDTGEAATQLLFPTAATATSYRIAVEHVDGTPGVGQFKYVLFGSPGNATSPGGTIDDPDARQGSGTVHGHQLTPGVNTVGAAHWSNAPAYGLPADWTEYFSSGGPGTFLYDAQGGRLAQPAPADKVDFVAPDGIYTPVPGFAPFFGASAAAPDAAAVAALVLQVDPHLDPAGLSALLRASALDMGLPAGQQGAGLIQADKAVALAGGVPDCWAPSPGEVLPLLG